MARSVEEIKQEIKTEVRTYSSLDSFLFPEDGGSSFSVFNSLIFVMAAVIYTFEVVVDNLKTNITTIAESAQAGNNAWLRAQILKFQFGDFITLTDFVPSYAVIDEAKRIVTRCAVTDAGRGTVDIKVAKGTPPSLSPLSAPELSALSDYYYGSSGSQGIGFSGVNANIISLNPDRIMVDATIYYLGQFVEATVKANVITAIDNYLNTFAEENFDGSIYMIDLVDAIQAVSGVRRVVVNEVKVRPETVPFASATTLDIQGKYRTVAGYIISEDESGNTLNDTITMAREI